MCDDAITKMTVSMIFCFLVFIDDKHRQRRLDGFTLFYSFALKWSPVYSPWCCTYVLAETVVGTL